MEATKGVEFDGKFWYHYSRILTMKHTDGNTKSQALDRGKRNKTAILGLSAFYHDSAAALIVDGRIVAAAQEERFTRQKHDRRFPERAIEYCLAEANIEPADIDYVGFYDKPLLKFERLHETFLAFAPRGFRFFRNAVTGWTGGKLNLPRCIRRGLSGAYRKRIVFTEHHESHAASAFFPSPFDEAAILTLDGVGEWATACYGTGRGNRIELTHEMRFPHSVGLLYSAFTYFCGFKVNSDEYKLMGLAPYGEPRYAELILDKLVDIHEDGSIRMDMSYFNYCRGVTMTSRKFERLFGGPPRRPESPITQREKDMAASVQHVTEEIMLRMSRHIYARTQMKHLCMAGGVALNCVANGRLLREGPFDDIWIQPAAGDAGGALGVALFIWYQLLGNPRQAKKTDDMHGSLLGPSYSDDEIGEFLKTVDAKCERISDAENLCDTVADEIASGKVVAWFQGRMEFGPRALGCRSILGDARRGDLQSAINSKIKFREGFRPFAPALLAEHASDYFSMQTGRERPYMLLAAPVQQEKLTERGAEIPAATHLDLSARVQTVDPERHGLFRTLLDTFHRKTGCPVVVNTSFNLSWEPIVCSPRDAYRAFMASGIDTLCMGHYLLSKSTQPSHASGPVAHESDGVLTELLCDCGNVTIDDAHEVTKKVKQFYETNPFPNYDDHYTLRSLIEKARRSGLPPALNRAIGYNSTVLEVGCGTGQLTNYLGISCRRVIGTDICANSLRLGEQFRKEHKLDRVRFVQMDLFSPCFEPERFDVIICCGVLHHTPDPFAGFRALLPLLKPGGHIVIGLYNRYGRLLTDLRRRMFRWTDGRCKWIDPILRNGSLNEAQRQAWFADQYLHPHESKHTVGEIIRWFDCSGIEFVRCVFPGAMSDVDNLFEAQTPPAKADRFLVQAREALAGREGGLFLMIGRKGRLATGSKHPKSDTEKPQRIQSAVSSNGTFIRTKSSI
jgi:carbamoyltransferase